ncbi:NOL1/NOP2/sun family protein, partial [Toxoplasma gondii TgCatPRC2]
MPKRKLCGDSSGVPAPLEAAAEETERTTACRGASEGAACSERNAGASGFGGERGEERDGRNGEKQWRERSRRRCGKRRKEQTHDGDRGKEEEGKAMPYAPLIYENAAFEEYYKAQKICPPQEWNMFMACIKTSLPASVRVNRSAPLWKSTVDLLKQLSTKEKDEAGLEESLQPLTWMPHEVGWQWNTVCKVRLRRDDSFKRIRRHLMNEDYRGGLTRQEAVSMLPVLFLDVRPEHRILDMCASPGSKTTQILDMLQWHAVNSLQDGANSQALPGLGPPTGFVIANDVDAQRTQTLAHQCMKVASPAIAISCSDASLFPLTLPDGPTGETRLQFDRILADVPCSGDGTMRKNGDLWRKWSAGGSLSLHSIQLGILHRGLQLLRVGGRLVYSTCSLSPLEDEAVIAAVLLQYGDAIELVPPPPLPGLRFSCGLFSWLVPVPEVKQRGREEEKGNDKTERSGGQEAEAQETAPVNGETGSAQKFFTSFAEVPEPLRGKVKPTMFPPPSGAALHLDRAVRVLPHQNNSGGFFVACFQKKGELPARGQRERYKTRTATNASSPSSPASSASSSSSHPSSSICPSSSTSRETVKEVRATEDVAPVPACAVPSLASSPARNPLLDEEADDLSSSASSASASRFSSFGEEADKALSTHSLTHPAVALAIAASQPGRLFHTLLPIDLHAEEGFESALSFYGFSRNSAPALVKGDLRHAQALQDLPVRQLTRRLHTPRRVYFVSESFSDLLHLLLLPPHKPRPSSSASIGQGEGEAEGESERRASGEEEQRGESRLAPARAPKKGRDEFRMKWLHAGVKVLVQHSGTHQLSGRFGADGWRVTQ